MIPLIEKGDRIILLDERGKKYFVKVDERHLHTNLGVVDLSQIIGQESGFKLRSHLDKEFTVLKPRVTDYLEKLKRVPQVVLPKDAAQIAAYTGVGPGDLVVDAGTGSGFLAIFLGNLVRPGGQVISYEIREDFAEMAEENIATAGLADVVKVKVADIYRGIEEKEVDLVTLDLPEPERALPHAEKALKLGGYLAVFSPCIETVQRLHEAFKNHSFLEKRTIECLVREFEAGKRGTRPKTRMIAHTGYLSFARKV